MVKTCQFISVLFSAIGLVRVTCQILACCVAPDTALAAQRNTEGSVASPEAPGYS